MLCKCLGRQERTVYWMLRARFIATNGRSTHTKGPSFHPCTASNHITKISLKMHQLHHHYFGLLAYRMLCVCVCVCAPFVIFEDETMNFQYKNNERDVDVCIKKLLKVEWINIITCRREAEKGVFNINFIKIIPWTNKEYNSKGFHWHYDIIEWKLQRNFKDYHSSCNGTFTNSITWVNLFSPTIVQSQSSPWS